MARQVYVSFALISLALACGGRTTPTEDDAGRLDRGVVVDARSYLDGEPAFCSAAMRTCTLREYCATSDGDCGGVGVCAPRPTLCPEHCPGVCGCDGQTYCNACIAASQGVALHSTRACEAGDACRSHDECGPGRYCYSEGCIGFDAVGECRPRPQDCMQEPFPVCGCDGRTYANECAAAVEGVNVDYQERCRICTNLEGSYSVLLESAKSCCAFCDSIQCAVEVKDRLLCGCPTFVESSNSLEIEEMARIEQRWSETGCFNSPPCPPFACPDLARGECTADAVGEGSCKDLYR